MNIKRRMIIAGGSDQTAAEALFSFHDLAVRSLQQGKALRISSDKPLDRPAWDRMAAIRVTARKRVISLVVVFSHNEKMLVMLH